MNYTAATKSSVCTPCTNVPIRCTLCPRSSVGDMPRIIWKYNMVYHIMVEHSLPGSKKAIQDINGDLLIDMHISRFEETAIGIDRKHTTRCVKTILYLIVM
ncbi:hypothetical protein CPB84DRAFT_1776580, partial [Gymnopilus junonius]